VYVSDTRTSNQAVVWATHNRMKHFVALVWPSKDQCSRSAAHVTLTSTCSFLSGTACTHGTGCADSSNEPQAFSFQYRAVQYGTSRGRRRRCHHLDCASSPCQTPVSCRSDIITMIAIMQASHKFHLSPHLTRPFLSHLLSRSGFTERS
jgi:hypothetical protein